MTERYDYIIAGAGTAGLSLAHRMRVPELEGKKVLVVDARLEPAADKTWCFWHRDAPPFSSLVRRSWKRSVVRVGGRSIADRMIGHTYSCIRSTDFRRQVLRELRSDRRFELLESDIESIGAESGRPRLRTGGRSFEAEYIFQSCFTPPPLGGAAHYPLKQHFVGWEVELQKPAFTPDRFVLMDFDDTFTGGIAFIYLLPWTESRALVEYTVFSQETLEDEEYERKIELYLYNRFGIRRLDYRRSRTEQGVIPMDDRIYPGWYAPGVLNIGTVGGLTKPSTGYTFSRIQDHSAAIVSALREESPPSPMSGRIRHYAYDLWLLQIMFERPGEALRVFERLFQNNELDAIFRFLSERSDPAEELAIMGSVPARPFLRAAWKSRRRLFGRIRYGSSQGSAGPPRRKP